MERVTHSTRITEALYISSLRNRLRVAHLIVECHKGWVNCETHVLQSFNVCLGANLFIVEHLEAHCDSFCSDDLLLSSIEYILFRNGSWLQIIQWDDDVILVDACLCRINSDACTWLVIEPVVNRN